MSNAPVKKVELTRQQRFENCLFGLAAPVAMVSALWWYINLCLHRYAKYGKLPQKPVCINCFVLAGKPKEITDLVASYGVNYCWGLCRWVVSDNRVGLSVLFLVSATQFDYADGILSMYAGSTFEIHSNPGSKRDQNFGKPFAARQPTRPARKAAKLGRTY